MRSLALLLTLPLAYLVASDFSAPVATIDGAAISRGEYADYLIELSGRKPLEDLVRERLLAAEVRRFDPDGTALQATLAEAWAEEEALLLQRTHGDRDAFAADLAEVGFTVEGYRERYFAYRRPELMEELIVRATRTVDEADLERRFELQYGEGGVKVEVRHLMMNRGQLKAGLIKQGHNPAELTNETLDRMIAEQMTALREEILAGADFEAVARRESFDLSVNQNGGVIPNYNYKHYGAEFAAAVRAAGEGVLVGPVHTPSTVHLLRVESRTVTRFEDVRDALAAEQLVAPVEFPERTALRERLHSEHEVVYLD